MNLPVGDILTLLGGFIPVLLISIFFGYLGTFVDFTKRSGIAISSRLRLLISAILFAVIFILSLIGVVYIATGENLLTNPVQSLLAILSQVLHGSIWVLAGMILMPIFLGSLTLHVINRGEMKYVNSLLLSAKISIWPVIDVFWAFVFLFIFSLIYVPWIIISIVGWLYFPSISPSVFFALFGIIITIFVAAGPSWFIGSIFQTIGSLLFLQGIIFIVLFFVPPFGTIFALILFPLAIISLVIGIVMLILGHLVSSLGIVRVLGLAFIFVSIITLYSTTWLSDLFGSLSRVPILSEVLPTISEFIPLVENIFRVLGGIGILLGILMLIFGKKEEVGQIHTISMAVTIAVISFIPIIFSELFSIAVPSISVGKMNLEFLVTIFSFAVYALILTKIPLLVPIVYFTIMVLLRILYGIIALVS